jgi:hypothetical protein
MRNITGGMLFFLALAIALFCQGETWKEPAYSSEKPLQAFVALDEAATKVLKLILDESGGTGKGYDTIYADANLNGDLTDDKPLKGELEKEEGSTYATFPPIAVEIPDEGDATRKRVWQFTITYEEYQMRRLFGLLPGPVNRNFGIEAELSVKDASGEWVCNFAPSLDFAKKGETALVSPVAEKPVLVLRVGPDRQKEGAVEVWAYLISVVGQMECTRAGEPLTARVRVTDSDGKVVLSEDVPFDRLRSVGSYREENGGFSVAVQVGRHELEVSVDTGPIAGLVKATTRFVID